MMKLRKWFHSRLMAMFALVVWPLLLSGEHVDVHKFTQPLPPLSLPVPEYDLADLSADTLTISRRDTLMEHFFEQLSMLREGKDTVINIVHIGDSHLQAGHFTGHSMRLMQEYFGNAGRGWLTPYRLSHTNGPNDYSISSNITNWIAGKCIQSQPKTPIGIGGVGIQTTLSNIQIAVKMSERYADDYPFNRLIVYRDSNSRPLEPTDENEMNVEVRSNRRDTVAGLRVDTFLLDQPAMNLSLKSTAREEGSSGPSIYYGFNASNGRPGLLYHTIGVNGAAWYNYAKEDYVRQLALLQPSLLIISLGTNETFGRNFKVEQFEEQIDEVLYMIRRYLPQTAILLTTPPCCYLRTRTRVRTRKRRRTVYGYKPNDKTADAAQTLLDIAQRRNLSCFDLYAVEGGKENVPEWLGNKLLSRDRVHYTPAGYVEQATLFVRALLRSYNTTLQNDHADAN